MCNSVRLTERPRDVSSLYGSPVVKILCSWTRADSVLRIDLAVEPLIIVGISGQPWDESPIRVSPPVSYPHPRLSAPLVTKQPTSPCLCMEGIENPKPGCDGVRPPGRLNDIILFVLSSGPLLVARHPSSCELGQKGDVGFQRWINSCDQEATIKELMKPVTPAGRMMYGKTYLSFPLSAILLQPTFLQLLHSASSLRLPVFPDH